MFILENIEHNNEIMLEKAAQIIKIDKSNAKFEMKNRFLTLTLQEEEEKTYNKVFLHRAFPHELLWEYISVIGEDNKEIGLICNIEDFEAETIAILKTEI